MSDFQSYKLLENGGDPAAEPEEGESPIPVSKGRRQFLETLQSVKTYLRYGRERTQGFLHSLPQRLWTCLFIFAAVFAALAIGLVVTGAFVGGNTGEDVLKYIDPLIGTGPGGHVFAGATLPFGMAKPVADSMGKEHMGGFASDHSMINAFSSLHDSGTGGSPSMGNFPIFVQPACPNITECKLNKAWRGSPYIAESVNATPGYFDITLESGLHAEMTASERAALFKFSFTSNASVQYPVLMQDGSDLPASKGERYLYVEPVTGRMTAEGTFDPSFGKGTYKTYTCVDIKGAHVESTGGFNFTGVYEGFTSMQGPTAYTASKQGLYMRFKDFQQEDQLLVRVGLSWLSIERACENAEKQIGDWDFERLRREAEKAWRKKLAPIRIDSTGVDKSHLRNYWSGVYRAFLSPQDYSGENQLWNSTEPYYDSWYCIWDTFRGVHPFFMLVDTVSQSRMVRSLIDVYKNLGWLPDCRMSFCKGLTQGGSNADVIIVDSYMKKLKGVDWTEAYAAIIKDAEEQPPNWDIEGRGGLKSWKSLGYIPYHDEDHGGMRTRSVSRTIEYAYNDFCIAQMAKATDRESDYLKYTERSGNWRNVYNPDLESMGFKGFPQPRLKDGTWGFQNATLCSALNHFDSCYLNPSGHETYEGSPWLYLFYVPGDMQGLINLLGGRDAYLQRLDKLHTSGVLYMGDEQAFLTAFLYHYAGRPGLSSKMTHQYIPAMFNDTIEGIPGNDDSGAMGTFVFFSMLGIFPNAGQSVYFIIPPYFPSISITNPQTGKTATIRSVNFDPTYKKMFVQSAKLNGKTYTKNWVDHGFFLNGGTLELVVGDTESAWGTREEDVPPSLSTGMYFG